MPKLSAALLLYRVGGQGAPIEVLVVHPGGPFWARKDDGAWSMPKGEHDEGEDPLTVARREFAEEVGIPAPADTVIELGAIKQPSGKVITAFAQRADVDLSGFRSNTFQMEWPRGSNRIEQFPEVDKAEWFTLAAARRKLLQGQVAFLDRLLQRLSSDET
jgi:predicted NUDIX family NTP pyrophosphohydrolase